MSSCLLKLFLFCCMYTFCSLMDNSLVKYRICQIPNFYACNYLRPYILVLDMLCSTYIRQVNRSSPSRQRHKFDITTGQVSLFVPSDTVIVDLQYTNNQACSYLQQSESGKIRAAVHRVLKFQKTALFSPCRCYTAISTLRLIAPLWTSMWSVGNPSRTPISIKLRGTISRLHRSIIRQLRLDVIKESLGATCPDILFYHRLHHSASSCSCFHIQFCSFSILLPVSFEQKPVYCLPV